VVASGWGAKDGPNPHRANTNRTLTRVL